MPGEPEASRSTWPRVLIPLSLRLFPCRGVKGQGSCEDLLTWAPWGKRCQLGWSHSRGAPGLLGSNGEFGKACLSASRPAAGLVLAHIRRGFMRDGAKESPHRLLAVQLWESLASGSICPCVSRTHRSCALRQVP